VKGYLKNNFPTPFPFTPGYDFSGVVEAVAGDVHQFTAGDEVFGLNLGAKGAGTFAQYLLVEASKLSKKPSNVSFEIAASLGVTATTAFQNLYSIGKIESNSRVLILGGSSAVGSIAIQLAKLRGSWVATTASTRALGFVKQFGADKLINYNKATWEDDEELKNIDLVFDTVGDKDALNRAKKILKTDGIFVTIADFTVGLDPKAHPPLSFAAFTSTKQDSELQDEVAKLVDDGKLIVSIDEVFDFNKEGVVQIFQKIKSGKSLGKNLIKF
jgi:NADPH:quinone reductase-like Zn-dependent oxidoreductase